MALTRPMQVMKVYAVGNQYDWTKHNELDKRGGYFSSSAISADGNNLLLGVFHGGEGGLGETSPLFVSNNYGTNWQNVADTIDSITRNHWSSVDVSNDGLTMVAASEYRADTDDDGQSDGKIYVSEDGGDTWADKTPADNDALVTGGWREVVVSGDGSKIAAIRDGDIFDGNGNEEFVWTSEDGGETWADIPVAIDTNYALNLKSLSLTDNGDTILVGGENNASAETKLFHSSNNGDTWADITPIPEEGSYNIRHDVSADGSKMIVSKQGGDNSVYLMENDGVLISWTNITDDSLPGTAWTDVAISDDGSTLTAVDEYDGENGKMFISRDDGANWLEEEPGLADNDIQFMRSIDTNTDGSKFIVAGNDHAYTNIVSTPETSPTVTLDDAEGGKTIAITTPSGTTITCHSAAKEASVSKQDAAYSYPHGLVDFCFSGADASNAITLIFITDLKPNQVVARKYNPANQSYATISEAVITQTTYQNQPALQVTYTIVDNGPLDTDPDVGEIADPVGLGKADIAVPNTGISR